VLKLDNSAKVHACLAVAHFFRAFSTPENVMRQVSHGLVTWLCACLAVAHLFRASPRQEASCGR